MAKKLSHLQREINAELKAENGKRKSFTELEYRTNEDAITLLSMKDGTYKFESSDVIDHMGEYRQFLRIISQTTEEFFVKDIKEATARAFGIQHNPLINEIADAAYMFKGMTNTCPECGHATEANDLQQKIDIWIHYCAMVKEYIKFIKDTFPNWDKMKPKEKDEVLHYWKLLANAPFSRQQAPFLSLFIDFIDNNYQLNQDKEAKANMLLRLNFPCITTIEIARDVTTYSSLNK